MEHHPVADLFPMLTDDELAELADDIKQRGLLQPIVLDTEGRILDGRNRLAACQLAAIEPEFTTFDGDDPDGYALAVNIQRRNLTKGQIAMVAAQAVFVTNTGLGREEREKLASRCGVSAARLAYALVVLEYAPDLVDSVIAGSPGLDAAYKTAAERKEAAEAIERQLTKLRAADADLAEAVTEERMTLEGAIAIASARRKVEEIDKTRNADGAPPPTFAERAYAEVITWPEAQTLAEEWLEDRTKAIERARRYVLDVTRGWPVIRTLTDSPDDPYVRAIVSGIGTVDLDILATVPEADGRALARLVKSVRAQR
jgi:hypothetical protein